MRPRGPGTMVSFDVEVWWWMDSHVETGLDSRMHWRALRAAGPMCFSFWCFCVASPTAPQSSLGLCWALRYEAISVTCRRGRSEDSLSRTHARFVGEELLFLSPSLGNRNSCSYELFRGRQGRGRWESEETLMGEDLWLLRPVHSPPVSSTQHQTVFCYGVLCCNWQWKFYEEIFCIILSWLLAFVKNKISE